jgi:iron complex outermembrane recepter protein
MALGVTTLLLSGVAHAQESTTADAQNNSTDLLQEVVVTAQFRQERLQDTPIAITAVNAEMLEQRSQSSIADVTNQAPNVTLKVNSAAFGQSMAASIRGVGQYDFNPALEPGVGLYIDDVYYSTLVGSNFDLLDLDRVEILRGPQGTLAGKNSIGGAVKLYSKKPDGGGDGYLAATYGRFSRVDVRASGDFSLMPDKLFVRLSGVSRQSDGYVDRLDYACANPGSGLPTLVSGDCKLGTQGGLDYRAARAALRWLATDKLEVNIIGDVTTDNSEIPATTLLFANNTSPNVRINGVPYDFRFIPSDPYVTYSTFLDPGGTFSTPLGPVTKTPYQAPTENSFDGWGASGTVDVNFTESLALKSISAYRWYEALYGNDNDASPLPVSQGEGLLSHHSFSQELRLNGNVLEDKVDYTVGAYYFDQTTTYGTHQDLQYVAGVGPLFNFLGDDPVEANTKAGFLHAVYHVTDRLNLTGGYRYSKEKKDYTFVRITPEGVPHPLLGNLNGLTGHFEGSRSDYRADVDYRWTDDFMTYAQFSTGYKGGGVNPRPFTAVQVRPFGPETLNAYEIGLKSTLFGRSMRFNAALFYNEYNDIQLTLNACPERPCALPSNAGDAEVKGAEIETEIHPVQGLSLDAAASYLDFKYTRIAPNVAGVTFGMRTPYTPKVKANVGVQYEFPIGNSGSITPRFDASYQGELFANAVNSATSRIAPYAVMNARVTWRSTEETWQAALEVTNLTDKMYYNSVFDLFSTEGDVTGQIAMPRAWAVTVRRNFE